MLVMVVNAVYAALLIGNIVLIVAALLSSTMRLLKSSRLASAGALDRSVVKSTNIIVREL